MYTPLKILYSYKLYDIILYQNFLYKAWLKLSSAAIQSIFFHSNLYSNFHFNFLIKNGRDDFVVIKVPNRSFVASNRVGFLWIWMQKFGWSFAIFIWRMGCIWVGDINDKGLYVSDMRTDVTVTSMLVRNVREICSWQVVTDNYKMLVTVLAI